MRELVARIGSATLLVLIVLIVLIGIVVVLGPALAPHDPAAVDFSVALRGPSGRFPLGTDQFGRCAFSRLLHGGRATVGAAMTLTAASAAISVAAAASATLGPRWLRALSGRLIDVTAALPTIVVAIAVVGAVGPSTAAAAVGLGVTTWAQRSRTLSGLILTELRSGHVFAARAIGATPGRVFALEVVPAIVGPIGIVTAGMFAHALLNVSALSFLGLGAQAPSPEWGAMLAEARAYYFTRPQLLLVPGVAITLTVGAAFGLAHRLDDRLEQRQRET